MFGTISRRIFGSANSRYLSRLQAVLHKINSLEGKYSSMSDLELSGVTVNFRHMLLNGCSIRDIIPDAFAAVRESAKRNIRMRHFDVQILGGIVLHEGMIAEMKTGEGKTLAATLAAYLNAIEGKGVHVVTVNDYLATRDSKWMGRVYNALGMTVGCVTNDSSEDERRAAYAMDITYSTNNELGFDFLRDNMKISRSEMVHRGFNYAILDEIDSILIDESRTPLIISGSAKDNSDIYKYVDVIVRQLSEDDYELDEKQKNVFLTDKGIVKVEDALSAQGFFSKSNQYDSDSIMAMHYVTQALKAHKLFLRDKDYIVKDGCVIIIDEFTGRMMEGRRYSDGLHQALEAMEGLEIQNETHTLASTTFQNYFRMYGKLSGMTGTAATESDEFWDIYNLKVIQVPTNVPVCRKDLEDEVYATAAERDSAVVNLIKRCHEAGTPVLVGTVSIEKSEKFSALLRNAGIRHSVLNARYHEQEAAIIAQAGRLGAVTIATEMAGRGTDIQLGGNPSLLIGSVIDGVKDGENEAALALADNLREEREKVIESGGLFVIGTERHESRRIDNQLRGRSGRQGDPGMSQFFLSLDDDLLRIFGSHRIKALLGRLGMQYGESIKHPMVSRALSKAQSKIEARNYEIRRTLLKFDDVVNSQRVVVFSRRDSIIDGGLSDIGFLFGKVNDEIINSAFPEKVYGADNCDFDMLIKSIRALYFESPSIDEFSKFEEKSEIHEFLNDWVTKFFDDLASVVREVGLGLQDSGDDDDWDFIKKRVMITSLDSLWRDHISALEMLRHGISLRAFGQREPLNEFRKEAFLMLEAMFSHWRYYSIQNLAGIKGRIVVDSGLRTVEDGVNGTLGAFSDKNVRIFADSDCFCGSGIGFRSCCGKYLIASGVSFESDDG